MHLSAHSIMVNGMTIPEDNIEQASRFLKAAAHPLRLKIMCLLSQHEMSVQDIVDYVGTSQSNVSQHLAIMRGKGLLSSQRVANRVYYSLVESRRTLLHVCSSPC